MHPILGSRTRLLLYLLAWVPLAALQAFVFHRYGALPWLHSSAAAAGLVLFYAIVCLSPWYSCQYLPFKPAAVFKIFINHTAAAFTAAALYLGAATVARIPSSLFFLMFTTAVLLYVLATALHYMLFSIESSREAEKREQEARVLAREAELKALKAQINPHFLFNSLNSISALATIDGLRAREMCIRLSEFLRATLNLAEKESITLDQEMALAKTYLDVERVRFGERLKVQQSLGPQCANCYVPALILQPLVENAVKHGVAGMVDGGEILLEARCDGAVLHITIENDFDADGIPARKNGVGLANVRNRLNARYQNRASISTGVRDSRFCVDLTVPCD